MYELTQILPLNFAHGSSPVFVAFRQISVNQKPERAHQIGWVVSHLESAHFL